MKMKKQDLVPGGTKIHNVRFYNLTPRSIQCMSYNKVWHKLALSRNDGSIEIWDMQYAAFLEKIIPSSPENSVEGLAWAGERLFSVGLSGELVEWDLHVMRPRRKQHVTGNAIWCLDVNALGTELAIGTEEGYINIFDIADDQMQYKSLFDKQEGRVLCCKFDRTGEFLVTGSIEAIRIWDVHTGHAVQKMTVGRTDKKKEVIVWSLQVLSDFTIITGDSRGQVTVWDGRTATQIEAHQVLKADVLAVTVNEEETLLMCSGIEPLIRIYAKTQIKRDDMMCYRWVKYLQRNVHDHDVKTLVCAGDRIFSGGMDGYLGVSSASKTTPTISKYGPFLQNPCISVSPAKRLLLLRYTNYLEIWRLGSTSGKRELETSTRPTRNEAETDTKNEVRAQSTPLALDATPEKLLEFKSKEEQPIICAALSPDGQWLCYSTQYEVRLFRFIAGDADRKPTQVIRMKDLPAEQFAVSSHMQFSSDSKRLIMANLYTKQIRIFALHLNSAGGGSNTAAVDLVDLIETIEAGKFIKDAITSLTLSQCGAYIVVAGIDRTIAVWQVFKGKHFRNHLNLPRYSAATTALAIHAKQPRLVVAFADGKIFEYDLEEMCFTCSEHEHFVENAATHCITSIVLDERNPNVFVMQNDSFLFVLEKYSSSTLAIEGEDESEAIAKKSSKKPKRNSISDSKVCGLRLKVTKPFEHLINLTWLNEDELIALGVNPISLMAQLPDAFKQKKFGAA